MTESSNTPVITFSSRTSFEPRTARSSIPDRTPRRSTSALCPVSPERSTRGWRCKGSDPALTIENEDVHSFLKALEDILCAAEIN